MITTDTAFTCYLERTAWTQGAQAPAYSELAQLEQSFMAKLGEIKSTRPQDGSYRYLYSVYGKRIVSRIAFLIRKKDEGEDTPLVKALLASATRLREALQSLDPKLYKSELKPTIDRYHRERTRRLESQKGGSTAAARSGSEILLQTPSAPQPQPEPSKILSGTQGLADYLGCSRTMAFSIIKSGILKDDTIQYMVGRCWKFNREKLDTYLAKNPDILGRIRCKR